MKNTRLISFLFSLLFLVSCGEEEYADYTAPVDLADVSWVISIDRFAQDPYSINADTFMSFIDLSQGAVSHEWIIEEGNHFLNEGFKVKDSLDPFIDATAGLSITKPKAHILFKNAGTNKVRLLNKFTKPVSYKSSVGTYNAKKQGDFWVIDTTFVFDVYAKIKPAFSVLQDGVEVLSISEDDMPSLDDASSWPTVEVEAGASLTFVDNTTVGRANARLWSIPDGSPVTSNGQSAVIKFFKLGTYQAGVFKSSRITPLPTGSTEKIIPLNVKVIPSSQPFKLNGFLKELEDQTITFQVTGELSPISGQEGKFTVNVKNAASGFDKNIAVSSVRVSSTNATWVELKLAEPIYSSDEVFVSFSGSGITSSDTRQLLAFNNQKVGMYSAGNILTSNSWASYEQPLGALNQAYAGPSGSFWVGANGTADDPNWSRVETKAFEGTSSMKFSVDGLNKTYQLHAYGLGSIDIIPAGTYKASYMVYLEPGNTMAGFWTWGGEVVPLAQELWDLSSLPRGQWVKMEHVVTLEAITARKKVSIVIRTNENPDASSGRQTMYLDDFSLVEVEVRP